MIQIHWLNVLAGIGLFCLGYYFGLRKHPVVRIALGYFTVLTAFGITRIGKIVLTLIWDGKPLGEVRLDFASDLLDGFVIVAATGVACFALWVLRSGKPDDEDSCDLRLTLLNIAMRRLSSILPTAGDTHRQYLRGRFGLMDSQTAQSVSGCLAQDINPCELAYNAAVKELDTVRQGL
jgi:hypothetical protein